MKKVFSVFVLTVFLGLGLNISAQDLPTSFGPAPVLDVQSNGNSNINSVLDVNSRGFVYISTTTHQLAKQFMGNTTVTNVGAPQTYGFPGAFARHTNGTIYCNDQLAPYGLYTIDTTTGAKTLVVNITGVTLTNLTGITWDGTQMWGVQSSITASQIGTINLTTGAFTLVGSPSTVCAGAIQVNAAPNGTLFSVDIVADNLYKWNKTTGVATLVGALGVNANYGQDGHFDMSDGKYYWAGYTTGPQLRIIDTTNGSSVQIGANYAGQIGCLVVVPSTPPPPPVPTGTWTEQTSGITTALYSVSAVNDNVAWIGGAAGKVIKTVNGSTWTNAAGNLPVQDVYCIYGFDANNAIVTTSPSTGTFIYKTVNGGTNWTQVFAETGGFGDGFHFLNATTGFFYGDPVGARWSLWKTTNAGTTWDSTGLYVPSAGAAGWNNAMFGRGAKIWFGSNAVTMPFSSNSGATWANQTTPAANHYAIWFNDANVGLSGGANLNVTTNGGTTWTALTSIGTGNVSGIVGASTSWWFTRQTTAVNFSSNNGTSWTAQYTAPAGNFLHLALSRSGATIWGVRQNGGISRYGTVTGINPISTETPSNYLVSQNYPNPFNPTTKINFALPKSGLVTLKVYDITGKEVATLVNEVKNVGTYSVDFNGANLSSGMYFYKISVNGFSEVKKMSLIK